MAPTGGTEPYAKHAVVLYFIWILLLPKIGCSEEFAQIALSENPATIGGQLEIKCSFPKYKLLANVTIDAFNGTQKVGSLHCIVQDGVTAASGVLKGCKYDGCPTYYPNHGSVTVPLRASPRLALQYNCSVSLTDGENFYDLTSTFVQLDVQGSVSLSIDVNPVVIGHRITIMCSFPKDMLMADVKIDAFNATQNEGSLYCNIQDGLTNGSGVLKECSYDGCPTFYPRRGSVTVSFQASSRVALRYNCSVSLTDGHDFYDWSSNSIQLKVQDSSTALATIRPVDALSGSPILDCPAELQNSTKSDYVWIVRGRGNNKVPLNKPVMLALEGESECFLYISLKNVTPQWHVTDKPPNDVNSTRYCVTAVPTLSVFLFLSLLANGIQCFLSKRKPTRQGTTAL